MRMVELNTFLQIRNMIAKRIATIYALFIGIVFFVLIIFSGHIYTALITGVVVGLIIFVVVFLMRHSMYKHTEMKRKSMVFDNPHIDVRYKNEIGVLEFKANKISYIGLVSGAENKEIEIDINEDLFMACGPIDHTKFDLLKHGKIKRGYILLKEMPHGESYKFIFLNIDNTLESVNKELEKLNQYNKAKHKNN
ncbi:MAG: hypothetical protein K9L74_00760 [Candidatus Izimaplasma sp.]|nr:hypothetical protein [Candidatus Izimaplasma bacterium]